MSFLFWLAVFVLVVLGGAAAWLVVRLFIFWITLD